LLKLINSKIKYLNFNNLNLYKNIKIANLYIINLKKINFKLWIYKFRKYINLSQNFNFNLPTSFSSYVTDIKPSLSVSSNLNAPAFDFILSFKYFLL